MTVDQDIFLAANLGSEVTRLLLARKECDAERIRGAYERACGIIKELTANTDKGGQVESAVLQTILDDLMQSHSVFSIRPETLNGYFLPFARKVMNVEHTQSVSLP